MVLSQDLQPAKKTTERRQKLREPSYSETSQDIIIKKSNKMLTFEMRYRIFSIKIIILGFSCMTKIEVGQLAE